MPRRRRSPSTCSIPLLNEGGKGIVALRNEAQELGIVIDGETAKSFEELNDENERLHKTFTGLKNQVVVALLPTFRAMVDGIRAWVAANREVIKSTIAASVDVVIRAVRILGKVVQGVVGVIRFFVEHAELGKSVLIGLGVALTVFAVKAAAAWVLASLPIIALVAAITAVVLAVRLLIKHWDKIKAATRDAGRAMVRGLQSAWNGIKAVGERIKNFFVEDIPNAIKGAFSAMWEAVVDGAKRVGRELRNLPGIKQLADFGESIGGALAPKPDTSGIDFTAPAPSRDDSASLMRGPLSIRGGDINLEITQQPGQDSVAFARDIETRIDERMNTWLQQAEEVVG